MSIYDYKVKDIDGNEVDMEEFRGKTLLILNSATNWGFTKQYEALEELYKKYKDEGFEILDFPSDQFGQTPGTDAEVKQFGIDKYGITATNWGFTKQYEALEELYKKYKDEGFEILDFPSDQFGQTPGTDAEVKLIWID